jgi:hypothetical protein
LLRWNTVLRPGSCATSFIGPVPFACRRECASVAWAPRSGTFSSPLAVAQARDMTNSRTIRRGRIGSAAFETTSMVFASTLRTSLMLPNSAAYSGLVFCRTIENATSSAVSGEPSWNFTPWRSLKRQVFCPW